MNMISTKEMMAQVFEVDPMGQPKPFSISFYTINMKTRKGGELKVLPKAVRCGLKADAKELDLIGILPQGEQEGEHSITVHIPLIETFNGKRVTF